MVEPIANSMVVLDVARVDAGQPRPGVDEEKSHQCRETAVAVSTSLRGTLIPDLPSGRDRKVRTQTSTQLSTLMNAMRLSNAESRSMCESAWRNNSMAPEAQVFSISLVSQLLSEVRGLRRSVSAYPNSRLIPSRLIFEHCHALFDMCQ